MADAECKARAREVLGQFGARLDACPIEDTPDIAYLGVDMTHGEVRDVREAIRVVLASADSERTTPADDEYILPCDVHLPIAAVIKAGNAMRTLRLAMESPHRAKHFDGNPRSSLPSADDAVEQVARAMCDEHEPREIADQADAPSYDNSRPEVQQYWQALARAVLSLPFIAQAGDGESFQQRVQPWLLACFGEMIAGDREERNHRFLEEALELVQSCGCTAHEAHQLVDYVYGRDVGDPPQEVGGVMVTLAALCLANGLDMHANGETELARIWTKVEAIRAKQASKPKHSPLPQHVATLTNGGTDATEDAS